MLYNHQRTTQKAGVMVLLEVQRCQQKKGRASRSHSLYPRSNVAAAPRIDPGRDRSGYRHFSPQRSRGSLQGPPRKVLSMCPNRCYRYVAVRGQPKAIGESQNQNPPFHKFPAYGVFLLKRPKGTKSRRWARGLFYAWRELLHGTHPIHCPANHGGNRNLERDGKTRPALVVLSRGIVLENGVVSWG